VKAEDAARSLLDVVMLVMRTVAADMRKSPRPLAPAQMGSLMRIAASPCTMSELARFQAVSLPTMSKSVDMLVRRGWVERCIDKQDRRQTMARLTPSGKRMLAHIKQRTERQVTQTLAPLTTAEREQLVSTLNILRRVLVASGDEACALIAKDVSSQIRRTE
jgi:DNA-binding MarR family transcriptional regulator